MHTQTQKAQHKRGETLTDFDPMDTSSDYNCAGEGAQPVDPMSDGQSQHLISYTITAIYSHAILEDLQELPTRNSNGMVFFTRANVVPAIARAASK